MFVVLGDQRLWRWVGAFLALWSSAGAVWSQSAGGGVAPILAAAPVLASGLPTHAVFEDLLRMATSVHPQVRAAVAQSDGAKLDVDVAKWAYWPTLSVNLQRNDVASSFPQAGSVLNVQQPVWTAGALSGRVAVAQKLDQSSAEQVNVVRGDLALRLVDVWATLLDAEANRSVSVRTLEGLQRYHGIMQRRVAAGLSSSVELKLLAVRVSRAQADLVDAQSALQMALQRMEQLVGAPLQTLLSALRLPLPQAPLAQWVTATQSSDITQRLALHPAVRKAELDAAAAAQQLDVQRAERWPKLVLSYQRRLSDVPAGAEQALWTLGLNYSPGAGLSSVTQSSADRARLQARLEAVDAVRQEKQEQLLQDWTTLKREFDRQGALVGTIENASQVLESYERQYFGGLKSWLEVLNALQELSVTELRMAQAGNATTLAYYRWRLRGGELPTNADWTR